MMRIILICLFLFNYAFATDYYVRTDGSNGNTGTSNTSGGAWLTLVYAAAHTTSGDIIHVAAGTYTETAQIVLGTGISIEGADSATTIIKSTLTADFTEMLNMRSAMGTNGNQHISGLQFDGQGTTFALIRINGRSNVSIYNCSFKDAKMHGVTFAAWSTDDNDPGYPGYPGAANYCTGNSFYNNKMFSCGGWTGTTGFGNIQIGGQSGFQLYNDSIIQNKPPYENGWPVKYWQGGYNIGLKIHDNYLQHRKQDFTLGDLNWDFAIEMFNVAGMEVYNNTIVNGAVDVNGTTSTGFNTGVGGFWCAGYGYQSYIHDNIFYMESVNTHVQTGVTLEFTIDTTIIQNNTFDKFNIGVLFTPRSGDTIMNVSIQQNLFTNISIAEGSEGYYIDCGVYSGTNINFQHLYIYNNTFLPGTSAPEKGIMLPNSTSGGALNDIRIKNCIIKGISGAPIQVREGTVAISNLDIQYNDLYGNGNSNLPSYFVTPTPGYTFSNNVNVNPSFGTWYALVEGSTLIDAGVDVGLPYTGTAPNINWTENTAPAPPVECNAFDEAHVGPGSVLSNSNRTITKSGFADNTSFVTTAKTANKWFWYVDIVNIDVVSDPYNFYVGMATADQLTTSTPTGLYAYSIRSDGQWFHDGFYSPTGTSGTWTDGFQNGDRIGFGLDLDGSTLRAYKWNGSDWTEKNNYAVTIPAGSWYPIVAAFGRPFEYTINLAPTVVPLGYEAYCTASSGGVILIRANRRVRFQ